MLLMFEAVLILLLAVLASDTKLAILPDVTPATNAVICEASARSTAMVVPSATLLMDAMSFCVTLATAVCALSVVA